MTIGSNATTAEPYMDEAPEPGCKSLPRVDVLSEMRVPPPHTHDVAKKWWVWSGATHVGDCTLQDEMLTLKADGTANFFGHVISSDDDDQGVFYGGISLLDVHGAVLWTSPKLVGPQMNWEDHLGPGFCFPRPVVRLGRRCADQPGALLTVSAHPTLIGRRRVTRRPTTRTPRNSRQPLRVHQVDMAAKVGCTSDAPKSFKERE
jgi:hypothetical protein